MIGLISTEILTGFFNVIFRSCNIPYSLSLDHRCHGYNGLFLAIVV